MRKNVKLLALTGVASLIAWTTGSAQIGIDSLPEGLPTGDITALDDNQFTSPTFGDFELDTSTKNRVIHTVLGPMIWDWNESTELVTLHSEWYGDLYTHVPGVSEDKKSASGLGFEWPYLKSKLTGFQYRIEVTGDPYDLESAPFYNHGQVNGADIGWQHSIGIDLFNAKNYYKAAETIVSQMQQALSNMTTLQQEYVDLPVSIATGQGAIDNKFNEIEQQFLTIHELYTKFVFYYNRCSLAPVWGNRVGLSDNDVKLANAYVKQLPNLGNVAVGTYGNGQEILYVNSVNLKTEKTNRLNQLIAAEKARQAAEQQNNNNSGGGSSGGGSTDGGGTTPPPPSNGGGGSDPIVVEGDAIRWENVDQVGSTANQGIERFNVSAKLSGVNPHMGSYYGPRSWYLGLSISGTQNWQSYDPYGNGGRITGNIWIFVPQGNGRYWATVFEGYGNNATNFPAGNLNFEHHNILAGTPMAYPWLPQSGVQYGWMVSTNLIYPGRNGDQRSNIIIQAWP